ncbi:hypothetical protein X733_13860 [Mesorhizobium sp. L2C067A000]|nr:hypothetical protein X733_13860 [Mesorhizobium sp. L2C067A000]
MHVLIGGTPLKSLGWQRDLGRVRVRYRPLDVEYLLEFLHALEAETRLEIDRLTYTAPGQLELFPDHSVSSEVPPTGN